jgi:hypothetical protein
MVIGFLEINSPYNFAVGILAILPSGAILKAAGPAGLQTASSYMQTFGKNCKVPTLC